MKKLISCRTPAYNTHRPALRDISNKKSDPGQLLALEYNKNRLANLKEQLSVEATKRLASEEQLKRKDDELKKKDDELKKKDDELAQLRAIMAEMQGKRSTNPRLPLAPHRS